MSTPAPVLEEEEARLELGVDELDPVEVVPVEVLDADAAAPPAPPPPPAVLACSPEPQL